MKKFNAKRFFTLLATGVLSVSMMGSLCACDLGLGGGKDDDDDKKDNNNDPPAVQLIAAPTGAPDYSAHEDEKMFIAAWNAAPDAQYEYTQAELSAAKDAGIDALCDVRISRNSQKINVKNLQAIKAAGLKAILNLAGLSYDDICAGGYQSGVGDFLDEDFIAGINFWDEPSKQEFTSQRLEEKAAQFLQDHPGKLAYVNLLPNYASPDQLGASNFADYIQSYVQTVTSVTHLSYDFYPLVGQMSGGQVMSNGLNSLWLPSLEIISNAAKSVNKPLWVFIQAMSFGANNRSPQSTADITFQNYVNMCYGARVLQYFCLTTPNKQPGGEFGPYDWGMLDRENQKTANFTYVKEANEQLQNFAYAYLQFEWENVMAVTGTVASEPSNTGFDMLQTAMTSSEHFTATANVDTLIGQFHDENGYKGYMVANMRDPMDPVRSTVSMEFNANRVMVFSKDGYETVELNNGKYTFNLEAGDGKFLVPYNV